MERIAPGVYLLQGLRTSNIYALALDEGVALIDSGSPGAAETILAELRESGHAPSDLKAVVLTHAHPDHIGSAAELARRSGAQILAHRAETPYIEGTNTLPTASVLLRLVTWVASRLGSSRPCCNVDRALGDGEDIQELGGLRVIHTPGHTPGSICLYRPEGRVLFCGDLLFNGHPLTGRGGLRFTIAQFSVDAAEARESVRRLLDFPLEVLCCGHGAPILERAGGRVRELMAPS